MADNSKTDQPKAAEGGQTQGAQNQVGDGAAATAQPDASKKSDPAPAPAVQAADDENVRVRTRSQPVKKDKGPPTKVRVIYGEVWGDNDLAAGPGGEITIPRSNAEALAARGQVEILG